jgi:hypothetical protein
MGGPERGRKCVDRHWSSVLEDYMEDDAGRTESLADILGGSRDNCGNKPKACKAGCLRRM